jgi:hypothetical protein
MQVLKQRENIIRGKVFSDAGILVDPVELPDSKKPTILFYMLLEEKFA